MKQYQFPRTAPNFEPKIKDPEQHLKKQLYFLSEI